MPRRTQSRQPRMTKKQIDEIAAKHKAQTKEQTDADAKEFAEKEAQLESRSKTMAELEERRSRLSVEAASLSKKPLTRLFRRSKIFLKMSIWHS